MKEKRFLYMGLMDLKVLRRGSYIDRLIGFYELFGVKSPDGRFVIWKPEEIAVVIGLPDGEGILKGKRLSSLRAKLTRKTDPEGKIIKEGPLEKIIGKDGRYSWRVCGVSGLPDEALAILNGKAAPGLVWCRREQIPALMAKENLDRIPEIYLWSLNNQKANWCDDIPGLLDWDEPACWEFWGEKAANAVSGKGHPLTAIADIGLRLQVALTGVEAGLTRNLDRNPDWEPNDPWAWTLHALSALVGREADWLPLSVDLVERLRKDAFKKHMEKVRDQAQEAVRSMAGNSSSENDNDEDDEEEDDDA